MPLTGSKIGFIGLGVMGEPMALNLAKAGLPLAVWSRSRSKYEIMAAAGAEPVASVAALFEACRVVVLMLADEQAIDAVLGRGGADFARHAAGRIVVQMGTVSPAYSKGLETDITTAGGNYVEAPVSGSRGPAQAGELVAMAAGKREAVAEILPILKPICRQTILCGDVPTALHMKFAVNIFLITMVTGLTEAFHFAERHHLDLQQLQSVLNAGPMASNVSKGKLAKLIAADFAVQAAIADVLKNNRLIAEAAREAAIASPLLDICHDLFGEAFSLGHGGQDMIAVLRAIEKRTAACRA